jgi:hypothetical protein
MGAVDVDDRVSLLLVWVQLATAAMTTPAAITMLVRRPIPLRRGRNGTGSFDPDRGCQMRALDEHEVPVVEADRSPLNLRCAILTDGSHPRSDLLAEVVFLKPSHDQHPHRPELVEIHIG